MHELFSLLFKLFALMFVAGLISPNYPIFWMPVKSRERVAMVYLPLILVSFLLMYMTGAKSVSADSADHDVTMSMNIVTLESLRPPAQQKFLETIAKYNALYFKAANAADKTKVWTNRDGDIQDQKFIGSMLTDWVGTVKNIGMNKEGNGVIEIGIGDNVILRTNLDAYSDGEAGTIISQDSALYQSLLKLSKSGQVKFSGTVVKSATNTETQGMAKPSFIVKFSALGPLE